MLARVLYSIYQGDLLNQLCFKNVGCKLLSSTTNKERISKLYTHFCQPSNMSKDANKPDAVIKDLTDKQSRKNGISKIENIKKVNIKAKVLQSSILQESDKTFQQGVRNLHSCKILKTTGSGAKCFVANKEYKKPFKKTVAFDLRPRVLQQCANSPQFTKFQCIKPCENLVGILKKSKENIALSSRNVCQKPFILKKSIYCAVQSQTRNFFQNKGEDGSIKTETENQESSLDPQDLTKKQITSQILEKNPILNSNEMEEQTSLMEMRKMKNNHVSQPPYTQEINDQLRKKLMALRKKYSNVLLRTASKSMNNLNSCDKSLVKISAPIQSMGVSKLCQPESRHHWIPTIARLDIRLAFSTSSSDFTEKNKCKSGKIKRRKKYSQRVSSCKSEAEKQDSSGDKCNPKNVEQRAKLIESCTPTEEEIKDSDEVAKLLESCFPKSVKSNEECDSKKTQTICKDFAKDKQSKSTDKTKGTCDKTPHSTKQKCDDNGKKNVMDVGCKSSVYKLCNKISNQITEYHEKNKKKKKKDLDPCKMTCRDVCADDTLPGMKRDCRFVCEDGENPCAPPKAKKPPKPSIYKEMFSKQTQRKKRKCSKTFQSKKRSAKKCPQLEKKKKIQKKSSYPDVCLWFQKPFRKKPKIYSGECEKPKKKVQRVKICENSFKKMLRKMQKRKTC